MKRLLILIAIASAFAMAAFAQAGQIGVRQWKLVQLNGVNVGESSAAYLQLSPEQTRFTGNAGCNRMFGSVAVRRNSVDFSNIGTTKMACADQRAQRSESAFIRTLENVDGFEQRGNSLQLFVRRRVVMKFMAPAKLPPQDPDPATGLEDMKWTLEAINGVPVAKIGRTAFLVFDKAKGSAGGNSSCNVFGGSYSATGNSLKIIEVVSTMRACIEDDRMRIEREFLDGLRATSRYEIHSGKLMLFRSQRLLLTFAGEAK